MEHEVASTKESLEIYKLLLNKLNLLENKINPMVKSFDKISEMKNDILPLLNGSLMEFINSLEEIEDFFQGEDLFKLLKESIKNVKEMTELIKVLGLFVEFIKDVEPLLKISVPHCIEYLDKLERTGVIRMINAAISVRAKIANKYDSQDIDDIGDTIVALLGILKQINNPNSLKFIENISMVPKKIETEKINKTGFFNLIFSIFNSDFRRGLNFLLELTKNIGKINKTM